MFDARAPTLVFVLLSPYLFISQPKPLLMAAGITLLSGAICATLSQVFYGVISSILSFVTQELLIGIGAAFGFFIAATLFKVQDE